MCGKVYSFTLWVCSVHAYVMHTCVWRPEADIKCLAGSVTLHLIFEVGSLTEPGAHWFSPGDAPASDFLALGSQAWTQHLHRCRDPNPFKRAGSTLWTEPFPQAHGIFINIDIHGIFINIDFHGIFINIDIHGIFMVEVLWNLFLEYFSWRIRQYSNKHVVRFDPAYL